MNQVAFYPELDDFRREWAESSNSHPGRIRTEAPGFAAKFKEHEEALFEQLLLFDSINLNILGPNVVAPLLYNSMGSKTFEALLEQKAISFVVWQPQVMMTYDNNGALAATFTGWIGGGEKQIDVEKVIDQGLSMQPTQTTEAMKRGLKSKLLQQHFLLDPSLPASAWRIAGKALAEGALQQFGLHPRQTPVGLRKKHGLTLLKSAESLLKCRYVLSQGMISSSDRAVFDLFTLGTNSLRTKDRAFEKFSTIAEFENFPNLRALFDEIEHPFDRAAKFRSTYTAQKFRTWLSVLKESSTDIEIIREYTAGLSERKGLFDSVPAKILKTVSLIGLGHAILPGASDLDVFLAGLLGTVPLSSIASIVDISTELGIGVIDSLILDTLRVGWTPRAYINGLRRLQPCKPGR